MTQDVLAANGISRSRFDFMKGGNHYRLFVRTMVLYWWYSLKLITPEQKFALCLKEVYRDYERTISLCKGIGNE